MEFAPTSILELFQLKPRLIATLATPDKVDVRTYVIQEDMNAIYQVKLIAVCDNQSIDFDKVLGKPASFTLRHFETDTRTYNGICANIVQTESVEGGTATYEITLVPRLWLLTQSRNYRMFQQDSDLDIARRILTKWEIDFDLRLAESAFKKRKYRIQYAESDYAFLSRLLEDAGVASFFDKKGVLVLIDRPEQRENRASLRYNDRMGSVPNTLTLSDLSLVQKVEAGSYTIRDHDYRRSPAFLLQSHAEVKGDSPEKLLERYHYIPGAFLFQTEQGDSTPSADDKAKVRHDPEEGQLIAQKRLDAKRVVARFASFSTTALDMRVGDVFRVEGHQHNALKQPLLVLTTVLSGSSNSECSMNCEAVFTTNPYRPSLVTPRPKVMGVESATVVGPPGEEIHTDEFGRVRVHFHWDREHGHDDSASCWIHVSQGWAGSGFGAINLPRVGHEVIVDFLGGDPDRPIIVGRVHTNLQPVPYKLPDNKTKSGWRSRSTPGGNGYNELMFEDQKGAELLSMHAERDMQTVVRRDQRLLVRNDREKSITKNERTEVGQCRTEQVGASESITIGAHRTVTVGESESLSVGASRSRTVGLNETVAIGGSRSRHVAVDDTLTVGGLVTRIYHNKWSTIRGDLIGTVGHDVRETIRHDRFRSVGNDETFAVGNDLAGSVAGNSRLSVDRDSAVVVGQNASRTVGQSDELSVGGSQSVDVAGSQSVRVGAEHAVEVLGAATESVALSKVEAVGGACSLSVGALLTQTVGGSSCELVGVTKHVQAETVQLEAGAALLRMQRDGEVLLGAESFDLRALSLKVEGVGAERAVTLTFGASKLVMRENGSIEMTGSSLTFSDQQLAAGGSSTAPYPPQVPPLVR